MIDGTRCLVTFDLEAILQLPCGQVSQLYYKRKLMSTTSQCIRILHGQVTAIYGQRLMAKKLVMRLVPVCCATSHSCLWTFQGLTSCGGQNKNIQIVAACLYAINTTVRLQAMQHTFLETGHTYLECDSVHAAIEYFHFRICRVIFWINGIVRVLLKGEPWSFTRISGKLEIFSNLCLAMKSRAME